MLLIMGFFLHELKAVEDEQTNVAEENSDNLEKIEFYVVKTTIMQETINQQLEEIDVANAKYLRAARLISQLQEENQLILSENKALGEQVEKQTVNRLDEKLIEKTEQLVESEKSYLEAQSTIATLKGEVQSWKDQLENITAQLENRQAEISRKEQELAESASSNQKLTEDLEIAGARIASLVSNVETGTKGDFSYCWYENVSQNGKSRKRAMYLFDIRINDDYIFVVYPWSSDDKRISLSKKITNLSAQDLDQILDEVNFDRRNLQSNLSYDSFVPVFSKLRERGWSDPDGKCTFMVGVWDHTSPLNKSGYKKAHEQIVGKVFSTYVYQDTPWPH